MATTGSVTKLTDAPEIQLGYFAGASSLTPIGDTDPTIGIRGCHRIRSLTQTELAPVECLIVDIRRDPRSVLSMCTGVADTLPLIVLVDLEQQFSDDYPYGIHISDITTPDELGSSVFWRRVKSALKAYEEPLGVRDIGNPMYSVFKQIADHSSDWILVKDLQHRFLVAGENFSAAAGAPVDEIIGQDDIEIGSDPAAVLGNPDTGTIGFWGQDDAVTNSGQSTVEENPEWLLYSRKARYRRTYRVPLRNPRGEVFALLVCSQDITEQLSNAELLAERTSMLAQVTEEKQHAENNRRIAEDAVAAKTRFLAAASHDMRQPLHAIGLFLDSLERRTKGQEEYCLVQQIKQSCSSLSTLFNSCLDISRLDAGVVECKQEHFSASQFLNELDEEFTRQAREKSLNYRLTTDDVVIHSDKILLARIVRNLLNNAIQNTATGYLQIECVREGAHVRLSVVDSGSGIAADELERVFNEFHQIRVNDARRGRGLGLGLSIVKRLCDLLDITITLESRLGEGSRFTLVIPAGEMAVATHDDDRLAVSIQESLTVLIIDDDQSIRFGMQVLLESYGCQALCAADAETALELLASSSLVPDIIVADYHLALDATGLQAILDLRKHLQHPIPAVVVTGDTSTESQRAASDNALPLLHKPVNSDELLATINHEVNRFNTQEL